MRFKWNGERIFRGKALIRMRGEITERWSSMRDLRR
jgi:hypothetical protein